MITINHSSSQYSSCHHFSRFNYNAKAYTADADFKNSNCSSKEKQIYHTISNDNSFKNFDNKKDNLTINFALLKPFQYKYKYQQYCEKYST